MNFNPFALLEINGRAYVTGYPIVVKLLFFIKKNKLFNFFFNKGSRIHCLTFQIGSHGDNKMLERQNEDKFHENSYPKMKTSHRRNYRNQRRASVGAIYDKDESQETIYFFTQR